MIQFEKTLVTVEDHISTPKHAETPNSHEETMILIYGKIGGVEVWGEYFNEELELNIGKYKSLNEMMCPRIWQYCIDVCQQI